MSLTSFLSNVLGPVAPQSEEEARRRYEEEQKAQEALLKEEAAKPVTQTLKIDPKTGEQTLTISGSPQDLSAANPLTPTVAQPGMPMAPVAPTSFDEFGTPTTPMAQQMPSLPQPGPGVQVAGPVTAETMQPRVAAPAPAQQMPQRPAPVAPQAQAPRDEFAADRAAEIARYEAQNGPMDPAQKARLLGAAPQRPAPVAPQAPAGPTPAQAQQLALNAQATPAPVVLTPDEKYTQDFLKGADSKEAMARIYQDPNAPDYIKRSAAEQLKTQFQQEQEQKKAEQAIQSAITSGNGSAFARLLQQQKGEGSYVKAYLFQRLGLNELAKEEQQKLGAGNKWQSAVAVGGQRAMIRYDADGQPLMGYDETGRQLSGDELAKFAVNTMPTASHLMPSVHGTPVVKQIGDKQIGGMRMYDPQTRTSYVQVGDQRMPDVNWVTTGQSPSAVYTAAGARQQGTQAAQTGTLLGGGFEPVPGVVPGAAPVSPADANTIQRLQGDVAGLDREIEQVNRLPATDPTKAQRIAILGQERAAATQRLQAAGGPVPGGAAGTGGVPLTAPASAMRPGENFLQYQDRIRREGAEAQAAAEANIALGKEERSNFLTYEEKDIIPRADAGATISRIRKQQLKGPDGILSNPEIVGIMSGQGSAAVELANLVRDTVTGGLSNDELSRRVNALGLTPRQKDIVYNQLQLNNTIAPETLKANSGAGSVSDAEQRANRQANIDVTRVPLYTAVTMLGRDQFEKDLAVARQAYRNSNPQLTTVRAFNDAWGKEKERLQGEYDRIYEARAKYIGKYYENGKNPLAITEAYKQYPVPEFSRDSGWNYGTDYARKAARKPLSAYNR